MNIDYTHTLHNIADRIERLAPSHRDPFRFHEEKSELVAELRRLAAGGTICSTSEDRKGAYRLAANDNTPQRRSAA